MTSENHSNPAASGKKQSRRLWLILGGFFLLALGALVWEILLHDAPLPDDADMMPHFSKGGTDVNPLAVFCQEIVKVPRAAARNPLSYAGEYDPSMSAEVEAYIAGEATKLALLETLMATDPASWQWPGGAGVLDFKSAPDYLDKIPAAASTMKLKALHLSHQGRMEEATNICLQLVRLGHGLQGAEGSIIYLLVAASVQRLGESTLETVLTAQSASPALLRRCLRELSAVEELQAKQMQFAIRTSYQWFRHQVTVLGPEAMLVAQSYNSGEARLLSYFFKPNRTLAGHLLHDRFLLQGLEQGWAGAMPALQSTTTAMETWRADRGSLRSLLDGNMTGKWIVERSLTPLSLAMSRLLDGFLTHRQARVMLALRLHELEKGSLPGSLADLVPEYLPSVPVDEYAQQPMRWNAKKQVVYSVGRNGKDDNGHLVPTNPSAAMDLGMRYWWSPPEEERVSSRKGATP